MYYLVTVYKYHGLSGPENVTLSKIDADDPVKARRIAVALTVDIEEYYKHCEDDDNMQDLLEDAEDAQGFLDNIAEDKEETFSSINWNMDCTCEGCYTSLHLFPSFT
jgi:hypothetical protein